MIGSKGNRRPPFLPMEIRAHVCTAPSARLAGELRLKIGQANLIWPPVTADRGPMAALVIGAIDQKTTNA